MPRPLRPPTHYELPNGHRRRLVEEVWSLYKAAGRPTLERIVNQINSKDRNGTASKETVRKTLRGVTVPQWLTLATLVEALCELSGRAYTTSEFTWDSTESTEARYRRLWNDALDEIPEEEPPF